MPREFPDYSNVRYNRAMVPPRRKVTRRRLRRVSPPNATDSAAASAPTAPPRPIRCMCGTILEISPDDEGRRRSCGTCRRRFEVDVTYELTAGRDELSIHYLTEKNERTGETMVLGSATTIAEPAPAKGPEPPSEPEPPNDALYNCPCGSLLLVRKSHYEKRVRCPGCDARMVVCMIFNPAENAFNLQTFRVSDASTGSTQILTKL